MQVRRGFGELGTGREISRTRNTADAGVRTEYILLPPEKGRAQERKCDREMA